MQFRDEAAAQASWKRMTALSAGLLVLAVCEAAAPRSGVLHDALIRLYAVPVLLAALYEGWRGGLAVALLAAAALWLERFGLSEPSARALSADVLEVGFLVLIAMVAGVYANRERKAKRGFQQTAEALSTVCERLQTDFEGMKRADRLSALGHLSAGLAHEIRNPLASISGAASILRRSQQTEAKWSRCIDIIESECQRLNGLLTTFLNFARPRPPHLQPVQVEAILDSVISLAQHAIGRKHIRFRREVAPNIRSVECDPEQMTQVLLNLLINATEASETSATVTLAADQSDDVMRIRVIDQGCGVAPADIDKLFNPFFTTKETGTGLGLPVAHQIVGQMGGLLTANRNASGGMTFAIEFPLREAGAR